MNRSHKLTHDDLAAEQGVQGSLPSFYAGQSPCLVRMDRAGPFRDPTEEGREMRTAEMVLGLLRDRGKRGLPLERMYRLLFNRNLYLLAYGKIARN
jgi:hypothetical protein